MMLASSLTPNAVGLEAISDGDAPPYYIRHGMLITSKRGSPFKAVRPSEN